MQGSFWSAKPALILNRLQVGRHFKFPEENYLAKGSRPVNPETAFFGPAKSTPRDSNFSFLDENKRIAYNLINLNPGDTIIQAQAD
jgi:hypothetical protein